MDFCKHVNQRESILVIDSDANMVGVRDVLMRHFPDVNVVSTSDPLMGLQFFRELSPFLILLEAELPIMKGYAVCAIVRGMKGGNQPFILMSSLKKDADDIKMDYKSGIDMFFEKPLNFVVLVEQIKKIREKREAKGATFAEFERARQDQQNLLPQGIQEACLRVNHIYSPFQQLSGDYIDYWFEQDKLRLCGYLFDVTGHDLCSYSQVAEIRALFKYGFRMYGGSELHKLMSDVNNEIFRLHQDPVMVSAIAFFLDLATGELSYCSAAIPNFFVKREGVYEEILMQNFPLGFEEGVAFQSEKLNVRGAEEIVFATDGFSELLHRQTMCCDVPKHDDVSAVFIKFCGKEGTLNDLCEG